MVWPYDVTMRNVGFISGVVLILMGVVWALQGLNSQFVPQSFMTGSGTWIVIGGATIGAGAVLPWRNRPWQ